MAERGTRHTILQVATDLFTSKGFASTSVREICQGAGITAPVLNYHFGSKDGLFDAVVEETLSLDDFHLLLRDAIESCPDPWAKLQAFVDTYLAHYPTKLLNPGLHLQGSTELHDKSLQQLGSGIAAIHNLAVSILEEGIAKGVFRGMDVETMAACVVGTIDTFVRVQVYLGADLDLERVSRSILDLFRQGLAATDQRGG